MKHVNRIMIQFLLTLLLLSAFSLPVFCADESNLPVQKAYAITEAANIPFIELNTDNAAVLSFNLTDYDVEVIIICMILLFAITIYILVHIVILRGNANKKINELLNTDSLTGFKSLNKFLSDGEVLLGKPSDFRYSLLYIDVDNFKSINDIYGYDTGDKIILDMAGHLKTELTSHEIISRITADRFLLLIRHESKEDLEYRLDRLINRLGAFADEELSIRYVVRIGAYTLDKGEKDMNIAMDSANYARCEAKGNHKSSYAFYDDRIRNRIKAEKQIEAEMETALLDGQFVPFFQPKVNMETGKVIGAEALVRWNHPDKGLISPASFIPIFEKNGFIDEIDIYIFDRACLNIKKRMRNGKKILPVSCNFSRRHLLSPGFARNLLKTANKYEVPTSLLELEITESVVMERPEEVFECMHQLKNMGFRIAIDDFGTGYSSLSLLKKLPADILKLDKSFLDDCLVDMSFPIIKSVVDIAETLGMQVVCEGVETKEQSELLKKAGCSIAQGFYYFKPLPLANFEALID